MFFARDYHACIKPHLDKVKDWVRYRTTQRLHVVKTTLPPGYYDADVRMLHAMFALVVDYVEIELAWLEFISMDKDHPLYEAYKKRLWLNNNFDVFGIAEAFFRSKELGLHHIIERTNDDDENKDFYTELFALYMWYTEILDEREDVAESERLDMSQEPWVTYNKKYSGALILDARFALDHPDDYKKLHESLDRMNNLEDEFEKDDEKMLRRLLNIRTSLWT